MSRSGSPRWILAVELPQLRVQRRMLALELDRLLEERLRRDGEELGLVRRPIVVQRGPPIIGGVPAQPLVLLREHAPPRAQGARRQDRRAVRGAVFRIQLVRELVQHDVVPVRGIARPADCVVPGIRRSTADRPRYDTTMRTKAAPKTASPSIRSPPRDSLVPPTIEPLWQPLPRHDPRTRERGPEHAGAIVEPARPRIDLLPQ